MNSLEYRKKRALEMAQSWDAQFVNSLFIRWKIPLPLLNNFKQSIGLYISKALHFDYSEDEDKFIRSLESRRNDRTNVTPNGGVVPKKEYALEYNLFLKSWCDMVSTMISPKPSLLKKFRLTPNIRIKYGQELEDNVGRNLDTTLPHSDAWVEGPWGMNCHIPVFGDTENNFLQFYKLKNENQFSDNFLEASPSYKEMQWVLDHYEIDSMIPSRGYINISDYALIHRTHRNKNSKTRVSIDTTIFAGDHDVHPDREKEYLSMIPKVGENFYVSVYASEIEKPSDKMTTFSHYTTGSLGHIIW